eukprot:CAMPEP_0185759304 /NCGR_PEP_ID=MMETSP1174-20130828/18050_1 /TAXON_ID=35687 /ORGANISM="Dictyocha speculum, Strain CCMP1381" /LENGTH=47 /DNA_ID= /DNA_START= /DNA_END= /DNA_ORIENTATION=
MALHEAVPPRKGSSARAVEQGIPKAPFSTDAALVISIFASPATSTRT